MTGKERFYATVERRPVDRPAVWMSAPVGEELANMCRFYGVKDWHELQVKAGDDVYAFDIPYDSADFSRCYDLVSFCGINPAYDFPKITAVFPWYAPILDRWETLSLLYERKQWGKFTEIMYEAISESRNLRGIKTY